MLEQRASQASPREQPFLYTMLVHTMTEKAGKEISDGDTTAAAATLKQVNRYAHLIQASLAHNTSQLKNAEMLMHHTTYRLGQFLHSSPARTRTPCRTPSSSSTRSTTPSSPRSSSTDYVFRCHLIPQSGRRTL